MEAKSGFARVKRLARALPGVVESTSYGAPSLKAGGKMLACMATNRQAEPGTLVVCVGYERREQLLKDAPDVYYLKDHYVNYPALLVRLAKIEDEALEAALTMAQEFLEREAQRKKRGPRKATK